jgi:hypothetical protein
MSHAILNDPVVCEASLKARQQFLKNANVFASLKNSPDDVFEIVMSDLAISKHFRDELEDFGRPEVIHQQNPAGRAEGRKVLQQIIYEAICQSFIRVYTRGAVRFAMKMTDAANAELMEIRYAAGDLQRPPVVPEVKPLTPQEALEEQVVADYASLSGDKMRQKMNSNRAYKECYERLASTDRLRSQITTAYDAGKVGG